MRNRTRQKRPTSYAACLEQAMRAAGLDPHTTHAQATLYLKSNVGQRVIWGILNGDRRPGASVLERLARALDCQPSDLVPDLPRRPAEKAS